jgi:hypothetical protein
MLVKRSSRVRERLFFLCSRVMQPEESAWREIEVSIGRGGTRWEHNVHWSEVKKVRTTSSRCVSTSCCSLKMTALYLSISTCANLLVRMLIDVFSISLLSLFNHTQWALWKCKTLVLEFQRRLVLLKAMC